MKAGFPSQATQSLVQGDQRGHHSKHPDHVVIRGLSQDEEGGGSETSWVLLAGDLSPRHA